MKDYQQFLSSKIKIAPTGSEVINPNLDASNLHPHTQDSVHWMLRQQRGILASNFGMAKTRTQIAVAKALHEHTNKRFLVVCPLGVKQQFVVKDGPILDTKWQYVTSDLEIEEATTPYLITNYERVRDGNIDPRKHDFCGVSLDEAGTIHNLSSKTFHVFKEVFADVPYRFCCTATPSPNNYREIIYYADFLGVMDRGEALTRWFKRNPDKAGDLTLTPQHEEDFWMWVASWALFLSKPSDLGYSDEGYDLPELRVHYHCVPTDHARAAAQVDNRGQRKLLVDVAVGVSAACQERRATLSTRVAKMREIIQTQKDGQMVVWCGLNDEQRAIEAVLKEDGLTFSSIYGSLKIEEKEQRLFDWEAKETEILISKPSMLGCGLNLQQSHQMIYVGIDFKFQDFIQSLHREYRFQQKYPVDVHVIYSEADAGVLDVLKRKWAQHNKLVERMRNIMQEYGLSHAAMISSLTRKIGVARQEIKGQFYTAVHNDCVDEVKRIADNSVGLVHTSIPFGNHYEYTTNIEDFGYNSTDDDFFVQMDFLISELLRILKPGRVAAIHVKDRILYGHQTKSGFLEVSEFSDDTVKAFKKHGFLYEGRRTIVTDVVRENNSTYRLGWSEMAKDASKMGSGLPEYLLLFRKPPTQSADAYADEPIVKAKEQYSRGRWQVDAHSLWRTNGARPMPIAELAELDPQAISSLYHIEQLNTPYNHERHVELCEAIDNNDRLPKTFMLLPPKVTRSEADMVWDDIQFMRSLNSENVRKGVATHLCPLPFEIVERAIRLYSNEGDTVLDPFGGLGTVGVAAIKLRRQGYTVELNPGYFADCLRYCKAAEDSLLTPSLFDLLPDAEGGDE